jgi:beta-lactam-binding protein with PASTA domain
MISHTRQKPLLAATLTVIAFVCFIVLPAIALSQLASSVGRERLSRPSQTRVPQLAGLNYETAETTLHNSKLNIRVLAHRDDPLSKVLIRQDVIGIRLSSLLVLHQVCM